MGIDAKHLLAYDVEDVRQSYTAKDSAFYALSVGMGQNPLDERRLAFVDPNKGEKQPVLPSMALILGYPGFWLVRPDTTIDPTRILHGSQSVEWHRPLPSEGEVIGKTRVVRLVDRGEGKHGMAVSERKIVDASTGELYATLTQVHVLRGQGGFGGDPNPLPAPHDLPGIEPEWHIDVPTTPDQALFYRLNGDLFALHADPEMARKSGFPKPILHGMCVAGIATQVLMRVLAADDPMRLKSVEMRFSAPIFPGETVRIEAWADGSFRARCLERYEIVLNNGLMTCG
jgi:acyl dehydratase